MASNPISVTLAVGSDPYQQRLPRALLREGLLRRVLSFTPEPQVADPSPYGSLVLVKQFPSFNMVNRFIWSAWKRLPGAGQSYLPKVATAWLADRLASRYVPPSTIFHGFAGVCLACMQVASRLGSLTILESPTLHLRAWQNEILNDCARCGINPRRCAGILPEPMIERAEREYDQCQRIVVLSSPALRSFEASGLAHKTIVRWPGVDHAFFTPAREQPAGLFRACYVGRLEVAKGVGYLLEAWTQLALPAAELLLVGEVKPEMDALLKRYSPRNVRLLGALSRERVAEIYREVNVFVLASANEGLANVLLEAMASGLPVIATAESGAADSVADGEDGFVVPARDVDALTQRILWCHQNRRELYGIGRAARAKIEQHFTLAHYEERRIRLYHELTG